MAVRPITNWPCRNATKTNLVKLIPLAILIITRIHEVWTVREPAAPQRKSDYFLTNPLRTSKIRPSACVRHESAAGRVGFSKDPSGMRTSIVVKPSLKRICGSNAEIINVPQNILNISSFSRKFIEPGL